MTFLGETPISGKNAYFLENFRTFSCEKSFVLGTHLVLILSPASLRQLVQKSITSGRRELESFRKTSACSLQAFAVSTQVFTHICEISNGRENRTLKLKRQSPKLIFMFVLSL